MDKRRILIVDDDPDLLRLLEHSIGSYCAECEVISASDGHAALQQFDGQPFDLILTDYQMPGMSGLELASTVHRTSPGTPIVLVTAHRSGAWWAICKSPSPWPISGSCWIVRSTLAVVRDSPPVGARSPRPSA